ncbi:hypothetical protein CW354_11015 [Marinicaulis flavus]|uniref:FAD/NAD(P)-binding domain-containing protein n=1 Tax=Hyphococcus luteus TaxID=2058213 RepID=A0A2S7K523_9PROT|nr:hypothetical protein CW354_11015 [Marinicaulis flavus]
MHRERDYEMGCYVIIGVGQAGAQGAASLRQAGYDGEIVMLGAEPVRPYQPRRFQRPSSKAN